MAKKRFALIGHHINHSISDLIHKELFSLSKIDASYELIDIAIDEFDNNIYNVIKSFDGLNVTAPYKQKIIKYLDKLDDLARIINSVNVIDCKSMKGFNTDLFGFKKSLEINEIKYKTAGILGAGGVARTIAFGLAQEKCEISLYIRESSLDLANKLVSDVKNSFAEVEISIHNIKKEKISNMDLLINATPVGMYPDINSCPIERNFDNCNCVFDCIYNPIETLLLTYAKEKDIKIINGLQMLIYQAVKAHHIWNKTSFDINEINDLCRLAESKLIKREGCKFE